MKPALHYKQITSIPRKCVVKSRSECDTSIDFCGRRFKIPFLPANMAAVVNEDICKWLAFGDYFYIMHRFSDTRKFIQRARAEAWPLVSISVGVKEDDETLINDIAESKCRVDFVTIDIAHGYSDEVVKMIQHIKNNLPNTKVIAGNIWGDKDSIEFLQSAGADAIKVGLSCGKSCTTFSTTSFGSPMFSAALEAGKWAKVPVILDGGVREPADIARAMIGFMANQGEFLIGGRYNYKVYPNGGLANTPMVMAGSIFAACIDAPGENIYSEEDQDKMNRVYTLEEYDQLKNTLIPIKKIFYGSASLENKKKIGQEIKHIEGKTVEIPCNGRTYAEYYDDLTQATKSQISYAGGRDLTAFKDVEWRVTS